MEDNKPNQVISDVSQPTQSQSPPAPQTNPQPANQGLDNKVKAPVVASKDNTNLKTTIVIVLAVLISLALIGVGYMAFMMDTGETETPQQQSTTEQTEPVQDDKVDEASLDQDTTEIDSMINQLDENADLPDEELNDSNLGM